MSDWLDRIYAHKGELMGLDLHESGESERRSASCTFHLQGRHAQPERTLREIPGQNLYSMPEAVSRGMPASPGGRARSEGLGTSPPSHRRRRDGCTECRRKKIRVRLFVETFD